MHQKAGNAGDCELCGQRHFLEDHHVLVSGIDGDQMMAVRGILGQSYLRLSGLFTQTAVAHNAFDHQSDLFRENVPGSVIIKTLLASFASDSVSWEKRGDSHMNHSSVITGHSE